MFCSISSGNRLDPVSRLMMRAGCRRAYLLFNVFAGDEWIDSECDSHVVAGERIFIGSCGHVHSCRRRLVSCSPDCCFRFVVVLSSHPLLLFCHSILSVVCYSARRRMFVLLQRVCDNYLFRSFSFVFSWWYSLRFANENGRSESDYFDRIGVRDAAIGLVRLRIADVVSWPIYSYVLLLSSILTLHEENWRFPPKPPRKSIDFPRSLHHKPSLCIINRIEWRDIDFNGRVQWNCRSVLGWCLDWVTEDHLQCSYLRYLSCL